MEEISVSRLCDMVCFKWSSRCTDASTESFATILILLDVGVGLSSSSSSSSKTSYDYSFRIDIRHELSKSWTNHRCCTVAMDRLAVASERRTLHQWEQRTWWYNDNINTEDAARKEVRNCHFGLCSVGDASIWYFVAYWTFVARLWVWYWRSFVGSWCELHLVFCVGLPSHFSIFSTNTFFIV